MAQYTKEEYKFTKPNRFVKAVFCHCSASDNPAHDNVATMWDWHVNGNGWSDVGYHLYIQKDGTIEDGRDLEVTPAAQSGYNSDTIAICCGGLETFTKEQADSLYTICDQINNAYGKDMFYYGHNQVAAKSCPVYDWTSILNLDSNYQMTTSNIDPENPDQIPPVDPESPHGGDLNSDFPYWNESPFLGHKNDMPLLRRGDKSLSVSILQYLMSSSGSVQTDVDGIFGPKTEERVRKIQERFDLDVDGLVGKDTWAAITHMRAVMIGIVTYGLRREVERVLGAFRVGDIGDPIQFAQKVEEEIRAKN